MSEAFPRVLREASTVHGRDFTSHAIVAALANDACWITHGGYPKGSTCLDVVRHAEANPDRYSADFGQSIRNCEHLCWPCAAKAALSRETIG